MMKLDEIFYESEKGLPLSYLNLLNHKAVPSKKGEFYKFLVRDDGSIVMSDTEFEKNSQYPLYQAVERARQRKKAPSILLLGWGIGLVIPEIYRIAPESKITVIEKYPETLELTPPPQTGINFIFKDANDLEPKDMLAGKYDVIWYDTDEKFDKKDFLLEYLDKEGEFKSWRGKYKVYNPHLK